MEANERDIEGILAENATLRLQLQEQEAKNQNLGEEVENLKLLVIATGAYEGYAVVGTA